MPKKIVIPLDYSAYPCQKTGANCVVEERTSEFGAYYRCRECHAAYPISKEGLPEAPLGFCRQCGGAMFAKSEPSGRIFARCINARNPECHPEILRNRRAKIKKD